jgi:predicted metal-dependent enzyme (double-stranded beta helix superfamily)
MSASSSRTHVGVVTPESPRAQPVPALWRLRALVVGFGALVDGARGESQIVERGGELLSQLIAHDDWLPEELARPSAERYQQYLLHCDSQERFSVVSFVWAPGQQTPVHDHRVWGLVGVLRGAEWNQSFVRNGLGELAPQGLRQRLERGSVSAVSPSLGDLHQVANAEPDQVSISIHVYGGNIGAVSRATYDERGAPKPFVSGYANAALPNFWQRREAT